MIERIPVRLTQPELARLDRYLKIRSVLAHDYCDREAPSMLRCPVGGCGIDLLHKNGILNPRCTKTALQSHFSIHHRNSGVYNFKVALRRGFLYTRYPRIGATPQQQNTIEASRGKGSKGSGKYGRQPLITSLQEPVGSACAFEEIGEISSPVAEQEMAEQEEGRNGGGVAEATQSSSKPVTPQGGPGKQGEGSVVSEPEVKKGSVGERGDIAALQQILDSQGGGGYDFPTG